MGKKQSPFIGRRVPLEGVLYARYTCVEDIVTDGGAHGSKKRAAPGAAAEANGMAEPQPEQVEQQEQPSKKQKRKDKKQQQEQQVEQERQVEQQQPPPQTAAEQDVTLSKKERRRLKRQQEQQERQQQQQAEGDDQQEPGAPQPAQQAGNAEEAARMRRVLGFASGSGGSAAAGDSAGAKRPAAAPAPGGSSTFTFNFADLPAEQRVEAETEAKLAAMAALDSADKDGFVPRRVFVGGMPFSYDREAVAEYWSWCGAIQELDLMTFPDSGRFRGIAFITFEAQDGADAALACDGEQLEGHTLKVERCKAAAVAKQLKAAVSGRGARGQQQPHHQQHATATPPPSQPPHGSGGSSSGGPAKTPGYNCAYVGNIAFEATPADVSALFEACGVTKVRLHTDKGSGKSRGYAHVHFADEAGLDRALAMSGTELMGRSIKVSYGQPKKQQ